MKKKSKEKTIVIKGRCSLCDNRMDAELTPLDIKWPKEEFPTEMHIGYLDEDGEEVTQGDWLVTRYHTLRVRQNVMTLALVLMTVLIVCIILWK